MSASFNPGDRPVVLITGAAGNLGRAVAEVFLRSGEHRLALLDRSAAALQPLADREPDRVQVLEVDLQETARIAQAVAAVLGRWGRIDALCNVAGGFRMGPLAHETPADEFEALLQMNFGSTLRMSQAVVPAMRARRYGRIINIGAAAALRGQPRMAAYCIAKSAVHRLTESMAAELAPDGIHVNAVLPSTLDTPQNRADMPVAMHAGLVPLERVAQQVLHLATAAGDALNGALIEATTVEA